MAQNDPRDLRNVVRGIDCSRVYLNGIKLTRSKPLVRPSVGAETMGLRTQNRNSRRTWTRHRELGPSCIPHLGMPTGHHLGTPRPMRSRVTTTGGRFPGSRVVAFDHLPRDNRPQWFFWPSARRLQLRGQLRNCIPVIAVGVRAPHSLDCPLARNHREHARIEVRMSQEVRPPANLEGF